MNKRNCCLFKRLSFVAIFMAAVSFADAEPPHHEFSLSAAGGMSSLNYAPPSGASLRRGVGGELGLGYTVLFGSHWGVGTGIGASLFRSTSKLGGSMVTLPASQLSDVNLGMRYELRTSLSNYNESQKATMLVVPLFLQYETGMQNRFYARVGGKVGIPLSAKYSVNDASIVNIAYLPDYDVEVDLPMKEYGLGTFDKLSTDSKLELGVAFMLSAEVGMRWALGNKSLYTGLYLDYGLNSVVSADKASLVEYEESNFEFNSELQSRDNGNPMVSNAAPLAAGVVLRIAFGSSGASSADRQAARMAKQQRRAEAAEQKKQQREAAAAAEKQREANELAERQRKAAAAAEKQREAAAVAEKQREAAAAAEKQREAVAEKQREANELAEKQRKEAEAAAVAVVPAKPTKTPAQVREDSIRAALAAENEAFWREFANREAAAVEILSQPITGYDEEALLPSAMSMTKVNEKAALLMRYPTLNIVIVGHANDMKTEKANEDLAQRRANAIVAYLVMKGVPAERMTATSKGNTEPLVKGDSPSDRRTNRRLEFQVVKKE